MNPVPFRLDSSETDIEVSNWTTSTGQPGESKFHLNDFSSGMNDAEELDVGGNGVMMQQIYAEKVHSSPRREDIRKMDNFEVGLEAVGVGRGIRRNKCRSSSFGQRGRTEQQVWDDYNNIKNGDRISNSTLLHCGKDTCNSVHSSSDCQESNSQSVSKKEECDTTQSVVYEDLRPLDVTDSSLDVVGLGRGCTRRGCKSSSGDRTPGHCSLKSPLLASGNNIQAWDYYVEIKNATNNSHDKVLCCEVDIQQPSEHDSVSHDNGFVNKCSNISLNQKESNSAVKSSDSSDQFLHFTDMIHENKFINCHEREVGNVFGSASCLGSVGHEKHVGSSEDSECSKNIFVSDECHKKDENDECQVQEEQNRKNRRIMRSNFMSDVLIISDPDPVKDVTPPSTQIDAISENILLPDGVVKKEKVQHKGENVIEETEVPSLKGQSADNQKPSPVSVSLNPDECTWDMMFDDNGECLDPKLLEEVSIDYLL